MSFYDYRESNEISAEDPSFDALIMAAMRKADDRNLERLKAAWPELWKELFARYYAEGGLLPGEKLSEAEGKE